MNLTDLISGALLLAAIGFVVLAAVGLQRFDDLFCRVHAATKAITLGVVLAAAGAALRMDDPADVAKLLLAAGLQLITAPVAAHMVCRAGYRSGTELSPRTVVDELKGADLDG